MFQSGHGLARTVLLEHYPWGSIGKGVVADVGESHESRSIALAQRFPSLHYVALDLPEVVADGQSKI